MYNTNRYSNPPQDWYIPPSLRTVHPSSSFLLGTRNPGTRYPEISERASKRQKTGKGRYITFKNLPYKFVRENFKYIIKLFSNFDLWVLSLRICAARLPSLRTVHYLRKKASPMSRPRVGGVTVFVLVLP